MPHEIEDVRIIIAFSIAIFVAFLAISWLLVNREEGPPVAEETDTPSIFS